CAIALQSSCPFLSSVLAFQLHGNFSDMTALEAGTVQLVLAWLARSVATGNGRGSVGAAAGYLIEQGLTRKAIGQAHHNHPKVHQVVNNGQQRELLSAVLGSSGRKGATYLAIEGAACPQATGLVQKTGHL